MKRHCRKPSARHLQIIYQCVDVESGSEAGAPQGEGALYIFVDKIVLLLGQNRCLEFCPNRCLQRVYLVDGDDFDSWIYEKICARKNLGHFENPWTQKIETGKFFKI